MVTDTSHFLANRLAPTFARARLSAFLGSDVPETLTAEARLLTSELVSNSVLHSSLTEFDEITLHLDLDDTKLLVAVTDAPGPFERAVPEEIGGWGLVMVERLADRWGIVSTGRPNQVWFELDR